MGSRDGKIRFPAGSSVFTFFGISEYRLISITSSLFLLVDTLSECMDVTRVSLLNMLRCGLTIPRLSVSDIEEDWRFIMRVPPIMTTVSGEYPGDLRLEPRGATLEFPTDGA
jgi:hypothetical protein